MAERNPDLRQALIPAGIEQISRRGIQSFSLCCVAEACIVSCASPYPQPGI